FLAVLAEPLVLAGVVFTAAELLPEALVLGALAVSRLAEQIGRASCGVSEWIAEGLQKVYVGGEDFAIERGLDQRLELIDGRELALEIGIAKFLLGDVGGILDHLERPALAIEDGVVACLDPDLLAALADPLVLAGVVFAAPELLPEALVLRALAVSRLDE